MLRIDWNWGFSSFSGPWSGHFSRFILHFSEHNSMQVSLLELLGWSRCSHCGSLMWFSNGQSNGSNGSNGHGRNQNNVCVANGKKNLAKSWTLALSQDSFVGFSPRSSHSSPFSTDFPSIFHRFWQEAAGQPVRGRTLGGRWRRHSRLPEDPELSLFCLESEVLTCRFNIFSHSEPRHLRKYSDILSHPKFWLRKVIPGSNAFWSGVCFVVLTHSHGFSLVSSLSSRMDNGC